jgi:hypothetical protein
MVNLINLKDMNDYMRVRFTDGVIADVIKINIEAFCWGKTFSPPEDIIKHNIKVDRFNVDSGKWNGVYIFSPSPKKQIILGSDGITTTTHLIPYQPRYRYSLVCRFESKKLELIWYDDAPPVYAGIYDVFQKMAEQVEFYRYAEEWN